MRAVSRYVVMADPITRTYLVTGAGEESYAVDLTDDTSNPCDCGDHTWRGHLCKHALAALLFEGNPRVITALGRCVRDAWLTSMKPIEIDPATAA